MIKSTKKTQEKPLTLTFEQFYGACNQVVDRLVPEIAKRVHDYLMNEMRDNIAMRAREVSADEIFEFFSWLKREREREITPVKPRAVRTKRR